MARISRPPGFDMTYRPAERVFGPPLWVRLPSFVYLAVACAVAVLVLVGEMSTAGSTLHYYVVQRNVGRVLGARALALILLLSAFSSMMRASMRGVRIRPDGIELRDVVSLVWPRIKRYKWAQIDQIILDQPSIAVDLWDGTRALLPAVGDRGGLAKTLETIAHARAIPIRGGRGLDDLPESGEFEEEEAE